MGRRILTFLIVLVSLYHIQGFVLETYDEFMPRASIYDQAKKALNEVKTKINKLIVDAVAAVNKEKDATVKMGEKVISEGIPALQKIADTFSVEIDKAIEKYKEEGIDITECAKNIDSQIRQLEEKHAAVLPECVNKNVNEAEAFVKTAIPEIEAFKKQVESLESEFKKCGLFNDKCLKEFLAKAIQEGVRLSLQITSKLLSATSYLTKADLQIAGCITKGTIELSVEGGKLLKSVDNCTNTYYY